jgi:hypothetical protein
MLATVAVGLRWPLYLALMLAPSYFGHHMVALMDWLALLRFDLICHGANAVSDVGYVVLQELLLGLKLREECNDPTNMTSA